jgi:hypothetical protein
MLLTMWSPEAGDCHSNAFWLPPETALRRVQTLLPGKLASHRGCLLQPPTDWRTATAGLCGRLLELGVARRLSCCWLGPTIAPPSIIVAIPAKDEATRIEATLTALARSAQSAPRVLGVVVFANNCSDDTDAAVVRAASELNLPILLLQGELLPPYCHAGWARRIAMDHADRLCGPAGVILSTDADTSVGPDWAGALTAQLASSADLVFGDLELDFVSTAVASLRAHPLWQMERQYALLHDQLRHICDQLIGRQPLGGPRPHYTESGASIGIRADLYRRLDGLPPMAKSEDRALARAAELAGARIRYLDGASVSTSGRLIGRACGGLADTIRRRLIEADPPIDERLRPVAGLAKMWANALSAIRPSETKEAGAQQTAVRQSGLSAAVRHALMENEWRRAIVETPMRLSAVRTELHSLASFLRTDVHPTFESWVHRSAAS